MKKICGNCRHHFISGMLQDWGGTVGYCMIIQRREWAKLDKDEVREAITSSMRHIKKTCSEFEEKKLNS